MLVRKCGRDVRLITLIGLGDVILKCSRPLPVGRYYRSMSGFLFIYFIASSFKYFL